MASLVPIKSSTTWIDGQSHSSWTVSGLTGGESYYFNVASLNWNGSSNSVTTSMLLGPCLSVAFTTATYDFGPLAIASSAASTSSLAVVNNGNIVVNLGLSVSTTTPSPWHIGVSTPTDLNSVVMFAVFGSSAAWGDFGAQDLLQDNQVTWSAAPPGPYSVSFSTASGVSVAPGEERQIWLRIDMPTLSSTAHKQTLQLTLGLGHEKAMPDKEKQ